MLPDVVPTYISASGLSTGSSAGCSAVSSAMLVYAMLGERAIYRNDQDYVRMIYMAVKAQVSITVSCTARSRLTVSKIDHVDVRVRGPREILAAAAS